MHLDDAPRLNLLPFILGDIALLLLAGLIAYRHPHPSEPLPLILITLCVVAGAVTLMIPILVNYAREQEEAAVALRRELTEQFKKLMAASEHLQHASAQLKSIEESAGKMLQAVEKLPAGRQERSAGPGAQPAGNRNEEAGSLKKELAALRAAQDERFAAVIEKIDTATAEWARIATGLRQQFATAATAPQPSPDPSLPPSGAPAAASSFLESAAPAAAQPDAATEPAKPARRPRSPRKSQSEDSVTVKPASEPPPDAPNELVAEPAGDPPAPDDFSQVPPEDKKPASAPSADGYTRLTVVSYVGIGNKLFLRGEGPGLSWDKGVPLKFVSIGRWRWETADASAPLTCKVYLNDRTESPGGTIILSPGAEQEVNVPF